MTSQGRLRVVAIGAGLVGSGVAVAGAIADVAANEWFGSGDVRAFAIWSGPFALWLAAVALLTRGWLHGLARIQRVVLSGLVGLVFGFVWTIAMALAMGAWVGAFSFPVLFLWMLGGLSAMCIWALYVQRIEPSVEERLAPRRQKWRIVLVLLGIPAGAVATAFTITFGVLFGSIFIWDRAERELHLLPAGYEGAVIIVFNDPNGAAARYDGKSRVYEIPESGVLRTQFPPNDGWSRPVYMYVDEEGRRTPIVTGAPCEDSLPGDPVQACLMGRMLMMDGQEIPEYQGYVVGRQADRRELYARGDSLLRHVFLGR